MTYVERQLTGIIFIGIALIGGLLLWLGYGGLPRWNSSLDLSREEEIPEMPNNVFSLTDLRPLTLPDSPVILLFLKDDFYLFDPTPFISIGNVALRNGMKLIVINYQKPNNFYKLTRPKVRELSAVEFTADVEQATSELFKIQFVPRAMVIVNKKVLFTTKPCGELEEVGKSVKEFFAKRMESGEETSLFQTQGVAFSLAENQQMDTESNLAQLEIKILWETDAAILWIIGAIVLGILALIGLLCLPPYNET